MGKSRLQIQRQLVAWVLLLGICIPLVLGAVGDLELTDNLILLDGKYIGLGADAGRVVFGDDTVDEIYVEDAYFGVSIPAGTTPAVPLHIARGNSPSNSIYEMMRIERYGDDDVGQDEIGASIDFYLEDDASQISKRGDIRVWMDDVSSEQVHLAFYIDIDGDGSMECAFGTQIAGTDVAFYDKDSGYHCAFDFTGSVSSDQILQIDMLNSNRALSMADDLYVEAGAVDSRINQDLTTDSDTAAIEGLTLNLLLAENETPASAGDAGTIGQIAIDSKYMYRYMETSEWKRVAMSTWTSSNWLWPSGDKVLWPSGDFILVE